MFFKELVHVYLTHGQRNPITLQFTYSNLFTFFAGQGSSLLNMQNVHSLLHLFASLCHILYFDAAKFSMKPFHLYI